MLHLLLESLAHLAVRNIESPGFRTKDEAVFADRWHSVSSEFFCCEGALAAIKSISQAFTPTKLDSVGWCRPPLSPYKAHAVEKIPLLALELTDLTR